MHVQGTTKEILEAAAKKANLEIVFEATDATKAKRENRRPFNFKVWLKPKTDRFRRLGFQTTKKGNRSRINAVCYHGYGVFMRYIFNQNTEAITKTAKVRYEGLGHFLEAAKAVGQRNIGSYVKPESYQDLCTCARADWVRADRKPGKALGEPDFLSVTLVSNILPTI